MAGVAVPIAVQADSRENLETVIPEMIRLLEAEEYETLITTFSVPNELKKKTEEVSLKELVAGFKKYKAAYLLQALKTIQGTAPAFNTEMKTALFKNASERPIRFIKIGNLWYLKN
jgi:hypothetical protein